MRPYSLSIVTAMTLFVMLSSCAKEDIAVSPSDSGLPMTILPSVDNVTRASMNSTDLQELYLQVSCADERYSYFEKLSRTDAGWSAEKPLLWKNDTVTVTCCAAFYKGHEFTAQEFAGDVDLTVPSDQSTQAGLNSADLLVFKASDVKYGDTSNGQIPVLLSHGLAKVNLILSLGEEFYENGYGLTGNPVTGLTITGASSEFCFQPLTGYVDVYYGTEADITPMGVSYTPADDDDMTAVAVYEAIIVPQYFSKKELTVTFSVDGSNYVWKNNSAITFTAGETCNLVLNVNAVPTDGSDE